MSEQVMRPVAMVDLDGVLATYDEWKGPLAIGEPIKGAATFMADLMKTFVVKVYTTRCRDGQEGVSCHTVVASIDSWLLKHAIPNDGIEMGNGGKPLCHVFIDDRAVSCRPQDAKTQAERTKAFNAAIGAAKKLME